MSFVGNYSFDNTRFCLWHWHLSLQNCFLLSPLTSSHHPIPKHCSAFLAGSVSYMCILLIVVWPGLGRKVWHLDLNLLICTKLRLWSCQLFGTNVICGHWLLWQHEILFIALASFISKFVSSYLPPPPVIAQSQNTALHSWLVEIIVCIFCWLLFDLDWGERGDILIWTDWSALK